LFFPARGVSPIVAYRSLSEQQLNLGDEGYYGKRIQMCAILVILRERIVKKINKFIMKVKRSGIGFS
jgi:hypothetical protein